MTVIIDGKQLANDFNESLKLKVNKIAQLKKGAPGLAVILVGDDPASHAYVNTKIKKAKEIGINIYSYILPASITQRALKAKIENLNQDRTVHGILVQLPLPEHFNQFDIINTIDHKKDVDGFTVYNIGLLNSWHDCLEPSTPQGVLMLLKKYLGDDLSGKKAVVIGRSIIVGRPMASILIRENCSVTLFHSKSIDIEDYCKDADILISAIGKPLSIDDKYIKPGACVIDVGITRHEGKLCGDIHFEKVAPIAGYITPVPGGVGPMTVSCMLSNTIKAMCQQKEINLDV